MLKLIIRALRAVAFSEPTNGFSAYERSQLLSIARKMEFYR